MPNYLYECPQCGARVELFQRLAERVPPRCQHEGCGEAEMTTVIQPTSFALKGGGWAKDLYASRREKGK